MWGPAYVGLVRSFAILGIVLPILEIWVLSTSLWGFGCPGRARGLESSQRGGGGSRARETWLYMTYHDHWLASPNIGPSLHSFKSCTNVSRKIYALRGGNVSCMSLDTVFAHFILDPKDGKLKFVSDTAFCWLGEREKIMGARLTLDRWPRMVLLTSLRPPLYAAHWWHFDYFGHNVLLWDNSRWVSEWASWIKRHVQIWAQRHQKYKMHPFEMNETSR